jgi:hypothetical protein
VAGRARPASIAAHPRLTRRGERSGRPVIEVDRSVPRSSGLWNAAARPVSLPVSTRSGTRSPPLGAVAAKARRASAAADK